MSEIRVRTPLTRRRALVGGAVLVGVWGVAKLAVWQAARQADAPPPTPSWQESTSVVTVSVPNGGVYQAEHTLAREAVERVLSTVNTAAGGRFRLETLEVTLPSTATTQVPSLLPLMASGAPPDLFVFGSWPDPGAPQPDFASAATTGFFQPLDPHLARQSVLALADFYPVGLELCRHKGVLLGVPLLASPVQLWYDRVLFETNGIPAPNRAWTWRELLSASRRLTDTSDADDARHRYGLSPGWRAATLLSLIWQRGGEVVSPDRKHARLDEPNARAAIELFADFYRGQPVSARAQQNLAFHDDGIYMNSGRWRMAMAYESAAWAYHRPSRIGNTASAPLAMAELPRDERRATALGVPATLSLGRKARNPDVAATALALLADHATKTAVPPPRRLQPAALPALVPHASADMVQGLTNALSYARVAVLDDMNRTLEMHQVLSELASTLRVASRAPDDAVHTANGGLQAVLDRT